jgi:hypothetical protein
MVAHARTKMGNAAGNYGDERKRRSRLTRLVNLMMARSIKGRLKELPRSAQFLQPGEIVRDGDYMQIGRPPDVHYSPVCTNDTCRLHAQGIDCGGVGHRVEHSGEHYWRIYV